MSHFLRLFSHMTLCVSGPRTFSLSKTNFWNICGSTPTWKLQLQFLGGTSTDTGKHAKVISASATWMVSGELAERMSKQVGVAQMLGPSVYEMGPGSWHKHSMITGAAGTFTRSLDFISVSLSCLFVSCGAYRCHHRSFISQALQGCMEHAKQAS